jgi:hypothetical protein
MGRQGHSFLGGDFVDAGHCLPNKPGGTDTHSVSFSP